MSIITRFAPSPTGRLHLGHAFSAIQSHDRARDDGGHFLLRIEDIDGTRSRAENVAGIIEDLSWLGLAWDGDVLFQSSRLDAYAAALDALRIKGLLYPCFCTRAEIEAEIAASGSAPHGTPDRRYPRTCARLTAAEVEKLYTAGTPCAWRLDMAKAFAGHESLGWRDELAGHATIRPQDHGDVVLARKDAPASYHLAVTVDDAFQGVTHVVRGQDLYDVTHIHRLLQHVLDLPTPTYRHHPLLLGADGERLAKRTHAPTLASLRAGGMDGRVLAEDLRGGRLPIGFMLPNG